MRRLTKPEELRRSKSGDECDLSIDSTIDDDSCSQLFDVEMLTFMPQKLIKLLTVVMSTVKMDTVRSSGKPVIQSTL